MLRNVVIDGYKSLRHTRVAFAGPLALIIGANAAGKSNLFDALALCSRMITQRTLQEAFKGHRGTPLEAFSIEAEGLRGLLNKPAVEMKFIVDVELSDATIAKVEHDVQMMRVGIDSSGEQNGHTVEETRQQPKRISERYLRYILEIQMITHEGYLRVINEKLVAINKVGEEKKSRQPFIGASNTHPQKLALRLEGQAHPTNYDIGLDYTLASLPLYPPHYPHITAFREELSRWKFYYLEPRAMREQAPLKGVTVLSADGSDLAAFYNTMRATAPQQFRQIQRELRMFIPQIESFDVERTSDGFLEMSIKEGETTYSSRVISEGTLRILGLLALTHPLSSVSLIGLEEPENGVHPQRLRLIADHMKNITRLRSDQFQILLNSHSPVLPQYFDDKRDLLLCRSSDDGTEFLSLQEAGLFRLPHHIEGIIDGTTSPLSERILRGDYGG